MRTLLRRRILSVAASDPIDVERMMVDQRRDPFEEARPVRRIGVYGERCRIPPSGMNGERARVAPETPRCASNLTPLA
jgi:hypothetical protein